MLWIWHDLFRIPDQEKGPDPTPIILNTLENFKKMPFNFLSLTAIFSLYFLYNSRKQVVKFLLFLFFNFCLDLDPKQIIPDPGKSFGSNRIWIPNTAVNSLYLISVRTDLQQWLSYVRMLWWAVVGLRRPCCRAGHPGQGFDQILKT